MNSLNFKRAPARRSSRALQYLIAALLLLPVTSLIPSAADAGVVEVGASGSYRRSNIDVDAFDESISITGSLSYYFSEASALEASYTDGQNKRDISFAAPNGHLTKMFYKTLGLDFVYTFFEKGARFRPYVKAGFNYILEKRIVDQYRDSNGNLFEANVIEDSPGMVPSGGFGFRLGMTESVSAKVGVDAWTSRPTNRGTVTVDYIGRLGLSFMF